MDSSNTLTSLLWKNGSLCLAFSCTHNSFSVYFGISRCLIILKKLLNRTTVVSNSFLTISSFSDKLEIQTYKLTMVCLNEFSAMIDAKCQLGLTLKGMPQSIFCIDIIYLKKLFSKCFSFYWSFFTDIIKPLFHLPSLHVTSRVYNI